jgi:hypothetical protein
MMDRTIGGASCPKNRTGPLGDATLGIPVGPPVSPLTPATFSASASHVSMLPSAASPSRRTRFPSASFTGLQVMPFGKSVARTLRACAGLSVTWAGDPEGADGLALEAMHLGLDGLGGRDLPLERGDLALALPTRAPRRRRTSLSTSRMPADTAPPHSWMLFFGPTAPGE